jgi:adenylate kinase
MDFDVIFIAGPQGSGKGTQGKKLADARGFLFWGMGGILREIEKEGGELAEHIKMLNKGTLLPDEAIIDILKHRLPAMQGAKGIVFDGVPRRLGQAEFLVSYLKEQGRKSMATVFLDLPREESVRRLLVRAQHEDRSDDTPEGIELRFKYYDETMGPTLEYLKKETKFVTVDGRLSVDEVARDIIAALDT